VLWLVLHPGQSGTWRSRATCFICVGVAARAVLKARPVVARAVTRTSGVAMTGIGALMLMDRLAQR